jgi:hypothetical protein
MKGIIAVTFGSPEAIVDSCSFPRLCEIRNLEEKRETDGCSSFDSEERLQHISCI